RNADAGRRQRAGVRRRARLGEGSARIARAPGRRRARRQDYAAARSDRAPDRRRGRRAHGAPAAGRQGREGAPKSRARPRDDGSQSDRFADRSGDVADQQADVRRRRAGAADRRRRVLRLPRRRRRPDRVHGVPPQRSAVRESPHRRHQDQHVARFRAVQTPRLTLRVMLSCAEASGDLYAGALTRELAALAPGLVVEGLGGPMFAAGGGRLLADYRGIAVTGLTEALAKIPESLKTLRLLASAARDRRPDALVVIDSPDFNFRLAPAIRRLGVPVVYYISPQIWAWRRGRLKTIRTFADRVLVIFPFEEAIYREGGVPVAFVGHPLVDLIATSAPRDVFLRALGLSPSAPTVALLPGSRPNEVARILPDLVTAAVKIREQVPAAQFVGARAPRLGDDLFAAVRALPASAVVEGDADTVLASADVALTASGTATVQTALHDTPMVVVYRVSSLTYQVGKRLVSVDAIAMVNLIAGEKIVPELIQDAFTPDAVAREAGSMLTDKGRAAQIRRGLGRVREKLGGAGASRRAAQAILNVVQEKRGRS